MESFLLPNEEPAIGWGGGDRERVKILNVGQRRVLKAAVPRVLRPRENGESRPTQEYPLTIYVQY